MVVQGSGPTMAFELIDLSTELKHGNISDLTGAIKTVNMFKDVNSMILSQTLGTDVKNWKVVVFTNACLCNISDGTGSTGGLIFWLVDNHSKCCPLSLHANIIKRVVRSTIATEALSLQEGLESNFYYRKMLENILGIPHKTIPLTAYVDDKSVTEAVTSTILVDDML